MDAVEYRLIPDEPGYRVGSDGSVWSCKSQGSKRTGEWHKLKPSRHSAGYRVIVLRRGRGPTRMFFVHALVLQAFVGSCPDGQVCRHLDGNPANNVLTNLAWGTYRENSADSKRHGTRLFGEKQNGARLTENDVRRILAMRREGYLLKEIVSAFHVSQATIARVCRREVWKHVVA